MTLNRHRIMTTVLVVVLLCISMETARGGNLRKIDEAKPLDSSMLEESLNAQRNLAPHFCEVGTPALIHYAADIDVSTYSVATCTPEQVHAIGQEILHHWERYSASNSVLGPIVIQTTTRVCPTTGGRRQLTAATDTPQSSSQPSEDGEVEGGSSPRRRRRLPEFTNTFGYIGSGDCNFCTPDDNDATLGTGGRRRLSGIAVPVTFEIDTDQYPKEMGFKISDQNGLVVFDFQSFNIRNAKKSITVDLFAGQTYTLTMIDNYGDGWCCSFGYGGLRIYDGIPSNGMDLIGHFSGEGAFAARSITFVVPAMGVTARSAGYTDVASILFPELESGISDWLTYYIQQSHHYDTNSCLYGKVPKIWVDLESRDQGSTSGICP